MPMSEEEIARAYRDLGPTHDEIVVSGDEDDDVDFYASIEIDGRKVLYFGTAAGFEEWKLLAKARTGEGQ
jgi:hypothetical protein